MTSTISAQALADAVVALRKAGCVFAEDEAALLGGAAPDEATLTALVHRRAAGEPLEQVVGHADFCGVRVRLRPGVFVPRVRSELLVRRAAEAAAGKSSAAEATARTGPATAEKSRSAARTGPAAAEKGPATKPAEGTTIVVDLCCGSGALGLAVAARCPDIELHAADLDPTAVACARDNLGDLPVYQGNLFDALPPDLKGRIDVLVANVPYVATRHIPLLPAEARDHEPRTALDGGADGLDIFRAVVRDAPGWLAPGGRLMSEITEAQIDAATTAVRRAGMTAEISHDEELEATVVIARTDAVL